MCTEARQTGINRCRTATLLRVGPPTALLDAGPDTHAALAGLERPLVPDTVLLPHAHNDHVLGLGDLLDDVRYGGAPCQCLPRPA
ncbi:MBL fold metallo-hydrolase [Deinococcus multiflagellatus]|uniref:MBL fold metallo-hydrolase n=1 Tax=Deinococcus multiflagellatus TaxID=1656887 RepID=UPI001CC9752B|nr:MBL fold metallo-hydrolase [Deinococcus multiflagellatus]MBZ9714604.1 MBL fold metallo-hydrolase [Deinococcus multiflagellatus]